MTRTDFLKIIANTPATLRIAAEREAIADANEAARMSAHDFDLSWLRHTQTPHVQPLTGRLNRRPDPDDGTTDA